ncbi:MAG TPA: hypothetical protein VFS92_05155 [Planctomycetota bacterium]|nr:hypothetical protein [Planctomycetota bacterium]
MRTPGLAGVTAGLLALVALAMVLAPSPDAPRRASPRRETCIPAPRAAAPVALPDVEPESTSLASVEQSADSPEPPPGDPEVPEAPEPSFELEPTPLVVVSGVVLDSRGDPLAGATVSGGWRSNGWCRPGGRFRWRTESGFDGSFRARFWSWYGAEPQEGEELLTVTLGEDYDGATLTAGPEERRVLHQGGEIHGLQVVLRRLSTVEFEVVGDEGVPLPGIPIAIAFLQDPGPAEVGFILSGWAGRCSVMLTTESRIDEVRAECFGVRSETVRPREFVKEGETHVVKLVLPDLEAGTLRVRLFSGRDEGLWTSALLVPGTSQNEASPWWVECSEEGSLPSDGERAWKRTLPVGLHSLEVWRTTGRDDAWRGAACDLLERVFVDRISIEKGRETLVEVYLPSRDPPLEE